MPPGRPRTFDRDQVLDGALAVFWHKGFSATTTRDLEATLGINQSSLYNTFGSKEDLLDEVLQRYQHGLDRAVLEPLRESDGGLEAIEAFLSALASWITDDGRRGCLVARLIGEGGDYSDAVSRRIESYRTEMRAAIKSALIRAVEAGEIPASTLERRLEVLTGSVLGLNLAAQGPAGAAGVRRLAAANKEEIADWRIAA